MSSQLCRSVARISRSFLSASKRSSHFLAERQAGASAAVALRGEASYLASIGRSKSTNSSRGWLSSALALPAAAFMLLDQEAHAAETLNGAQGPRDGGRNCDLKAPVSSSFMGFYMSRAFPRSNSSFFLRSGNALQSDVVRLREETFLVDAGLGTPRICKQDDLTRVPANKATRFENKVGYMDRVPGESLIRKKQLERLFIDLVVGDPLVKERAASRFNDLVGSSDSVVGEPHLLLPQRFRQDRAWMELNKIWRTNSKVRGFVIGKVKGGYSVAVAGYIAYLPNRQQMRKRLLNDVFNIERIGSKGDRKGFVVF